MKSMLQTLMGASVLISCAGAAVAALRESLRPAPQPGWAGKWTVAASLLVFLAWLLLVARDWHLTTLAGVLVAAADAFIIVLGIAWVPCFLLLQIRQPVVRAVLYIVGCVFALAWIGAHIPTHAIAPGVRADTAAMWVALPMIGFAFLNFTLVVLRSHKAAGVKEAVQSRLAWGTAALACVGAMGFTVFGWWKIR